MYVAVVIARALEKMRGISTQMLPKRSRCTIAPHVTGIELDTHLIAPALCLTLFNSFRGKLIAGPCENCEVTVSAVWCWHWEDKDRVV